jgi:Leucine-rich repeat (LRR) protein
MANLSVLALSSNRLTVLPGAIGRLTRLTVLNIDDNQLSCLPSEIGLLRSLTWLDVTDNALTSLPVELGDLQALRSLWVYANRLSWIPMELDRLPATCLIQLTLNPLPLNRDDETDDTDARPRLREIFAATTHIAMIRKRATEVCIALQDLELPALLTLLIIDELLENDVRMWAKWELVTTVKHFFLRQD